MQAQYRKELLSLQVCIIAPQTSYEITQANLYDYDLPPGLVTLRVAHTVMQLYRRGGRLTPKSVHKLLRLGEYDARTLLYHLCVVTALCVNCVLTYSLAKCTLLGLPWLGAVHSGRKMYSIAYACIAFPLLLCGRISIYTCYVFTQATARCTRRQTPHKYRSCRETHSPSWGTFMVRTVIVVQWFVVASMLFSY